VTGGRHIASATLSRGWLEALSLLNRSSNRELVNLAVRIMEPTREDEAIRRHLDSFITERRVVSGATPRIERVQSVANSIFPSAFYRGGPGARERLYGLASDVRQFAHARHAKGDYFERMTSYPSDKGVINQIENLTMSLIRMRARGDLNAKSMEIGILQPGVDEASALVGGVAIFEPGRRATRGFPCLSHVSVTLVSGKLHMSAIYRNHDFMGRAYGNYLGLGRLLDFMASESGFEAGELLCVSTHAAVEIQLGRGFGRAAIDKLIKECQSTKDRVA
jgi:hypothetical protein